MRKIKILKVNPTTTIPGSIEIAGDFTRMFHGRYFRNSLGLTEPGYTETPSTGYVPIIATSFDVIENTKHGGRYTVYTSIDSGDLLSSEYNSGTNRTTIRVVDVVPALESGESATLETDGYVTNISTYLLDTGTEEILVSPGVTLEQYPLEIMGRNVTGWGEAYAQNFLDVARNFAAATPPANPFVGQLHYDTDDKQYRSWDGTAWGLLNHASYGTTYRHTQAVSSATWTVNHDLGLATPFIGFVQVFVERAGVQKLILPSDIVFNSANQLTVTFSNSEIGFVLVRQ